MMECEGKWVDWNIFRKGTTFMGKSKKSKEPRYILGMSADFRSGIDRGTRIEDVSEEEFETSNVHETYSYWMVSKDGEKWEFGYE